MVEPIRRSDAVAWVESEDRVVVVRLDDPGADPLVLADSAAAVWLAIGDGATPEALAARLAEDYDVDEDVVRPGVEAFLDQARGQSIVA